MHRIRAIGVTGFALLVAGCATAELPIVEARDASIADAVVAIRLSPQLSGINGGATQGYLLLVDRDGHARAMKTGAMDMGQLAWTNKGLFYAEPDTEALLGDSGLTLQPRGSEEAYETSRFANLDDDGFIAIYNVGFGDDSYLGRVTVGDTEQLTSWEVSGLFDAVSQCGDRVVGITDLAETGVEVEAGAPRTDVLVQLYPKVDDAHAAILSSLAIRDGSFVSSSTDSPCRENTSYILAFQFDEADGGGNGHPVIRAWNADTGEHRVVPLSGPEGSSLDVEVDDILARPGRMTNDSYVWITRTGRVFSTDVGTGVTEDLFDISLASPEMGESQYAFTDDSVIVLDVSDDVAAPLELSSYDLTSGHQRVLMEIAGTGSVHDGLGMIIRDLALEPRWLADLSSLAPGDGDR